MRDLYYDAVLLWPSTCTHHKPAGHLLWGSVWISRAHVNRGAQIELFDMDFIRLGVLVALHLMVDWMVDSKIV